MIDVATINIPSSNKLSLLFFFLISKDSFPNEVLLE